MNSKIYFGLLLSLILLYVIIGAIKIPFLYYKLLFLDSKKNKKANLYNDEFNIPIEPSDSWAVNYVDILNETYKHIKLFYKYGFNLKHLPEITEQANINRGLNSYNAPHFIYDNKIYWYFFCKKFNINHPDMFLFKQNGKIYNFKKIKNDEYYVVKPTDASRGIGIEKMLGKDIKKNLKESDNFLVQETLKDETTTNEGRHYRLVTTYDGDIPFLVVLVNKKDFRSNGSRGALEYNVRQRFLKKKLKYFSESQYKIMNEMINKLALIHKKNYKYLFSIGWDIMFSNKKMYLLEGNVYGHGCSALDRNGMIKYQKKAEKFYKKL